MTSSEKDRILYVIKRCFWYIAKGKPVIWEGDKVKFAFNSQTFDNRVFTLIKMVRLKIKFGPLHFFLGASWGRN